MVQEEEDALRLSLLAVLDESRGKGVGRSLVREFLRLPGPTKRRVKVEVDNLPAVGLYVSLGFRPVQMETVEHVWLTDSSSSVGLASSARTSSG